MEEETIKAFNEATTKKEVAQIISDYMRSLAVKSHKVVVEKYGKEFYSKMGKLGGRKKGFKVKK